MAIDTTAFPEQGMKETQRLYENNVKPQTSANAPIEGNVSWITAWATDNTTPQPSTTDQKTVTNPVSTATETQKTQTNTPAPAVTQQPQKTTQSSNNTQQKKDNITKDTAKFNEMEQNRINYAKNKWDISKQIANDVAGELKALWERGGKLDNLTKNQVLAKVMQQYKDQIPQEALAWAMKDINNNVLWLQTVNNRDEVYAKFNKSFKKASNLKNTDTNELAKGLSSGLVTDSQMESLKNIDPAKYDEAYKLKNDIDKSKTRNNILNGNVDSTKSIEKTSPDSYFTREGKDKDKYSNAVGWEGNMLDIYDSMVNTQWVINAQWEINDLWTKITKLEREKGKLEKTITDEYGTSLSKSSLAALIRDRQEPINEELINLRLTMDGKVNTLNATKAENEKRFWIVMEERQQAQDAMWKNMEWQFKVSQQDFDNQMKINTFWLSQDQRNMTKSMTQQELATAVATTVWARNFEGFLEKKSQIESKFGWSVWVYWDKDSWQVVYFDPNNPSNILWIYNNKPVSNGRWGNQTTKVWPHDRDIDVQMYDPVASPVNGEVIAINENTPWRNDGNIQMQIKADDWNIVTLNHLDPSTVSKYSNLIWQQINAGDTIAVAGNSWNVMDINGNRLRINWEVKNKEALSKWFWSHLDIRVKGLSGSQTKAYLEGEIANIQPQAQEMWWQAMLEKDVYIERLKRGDITKTDQWDIQALAAKEGRLPEFKDALNQGFTVNMTDKQTAQYNKTVDRFLKDPVAKTFEEAMAQYQNLEFALGADSWPGDMAGVFTFMKTMDPTSVVRESEFDSAASSAGKLEQSKNIFKRLTKGRVLTKSQSEDFKEIAKAFIDNKALSYNRKYKDMEKAFSNFGIDKSFLPINASTQLNRPFVWWDQQLPTQWYIDVDQSYIDSLMDPSNVNNLFSNEWYND